MNQLINGLIKLFVNEYYLQDFFPVQKIHSSKFNVYD
jgi:hypothetical protein